MHSLPTCWGSRAGKTESLNAEQALLSNSRKNIGLPTLFWSQSQITALCGLLRRKLTPSQADPVWYIATDSPSSCLLLDTLLLLNKKLQFQAGLTGLAFFCHHPSHHTAPVLHSFWLERSQWRGFATQNST